MTKANATTTIAQACKAIVTNAIDHDYLEEGETLKEVFMSEYGAFRMNVSARECVDYLQGLPSVCTIPFYNDDILSMLEGYGIMRKSRDAQLRLIEAYWNECGYQFYKMIR